ncbi:hypothetical protein AgCh_036614 [Apium graveolens]
MHQHGVGTSAKSNQIQNWKGPAPGAFKINVVTAVPVNDNYFSTGHVSTFEAEVRGVYKTLSWIDNLDLSNIQIETDSMLTVVAVESLEVNYLEVGNLIEACKIWLQERNDVCLVHVRRQVNKAAHLLAHSSCLQSCSSLFLSPPTPNFLLETLFSDSTG